MSQENGNEEQEEMEEQEEGEKDGDEEPRASDEFEPFQVLIFSYTAKY
jgi:hypothetical protein